MPKLETLCLNPKLTAYDRHTQAFLSMFRAYVTNNFGERCASTDEDCPTCNMWALYDAARELTDVDVDG